MKMLQRRCTVLGLFTTLAGFVWSAMAASETTGDIQGLDRCTSWRAYLFGAPMVRKTEQGQGFIHRDQTLSTVFVPFTDRVVTNALRQLPAPSSDWMSRDFDDGVWPRYLLSDVRDLLGPYGGMVWNGGAFSTRWPATLCLRASFGVGDPAKVRNLKVTVTCIGGAVVYVNGREVGRAFLPEGSLHPLTAAQEYPPEAYEDENGRALPLLDGSATPSPALADRYQKRIRTFAVSVPANALVKGRNALAVELRRALVNGKVVHGWGHLSVTDITLTDDGQGGLIPYTELIRGIRAWNAPVEQQIANVPSGKCLLGRGIDTKTIMTPAGFPVRGICWADPYDELRPLKMAAPRNGFCHGQVVVSDIAGVEALVATISDLKSAGGGVIPASAVEIKYAAQTDTVHYCDVLQPVSPTTAKTVPVWTIVQVPVDASPAWYTGALKLRANDRAFEVPVHLLVTGLVLPSPRDLTVPVDLVQSPETLATYYAVEPWSEAHFKLLEVSFALMGKMGSDVLHIPVITHNQFQWRLSPIRFRQKSDGLEPDFAILEKLLDAYAKHCAAPQALSLYVWDTSCATRITQAYENQQVLSREYRATRPLMVQGMNETGGVTEVAAPMIGADGGEAFYKKLGNGVRDVVRKRGWDPRCVVFGMGGDQRPSVEDATLVREWLPEIRWHIMSHFSGDPGSIVYAGPNKEDLLAGKYIATGGFEVGLMERPGYGRCMTMTGGEDRYIVGGNREYGEYPTARWLWQDYSPPRTFRSIVMYEARIGRIGLDFWSKERGAPHNRSYFTASCALTAPGLDGAMPTVRYQMMREGIQASEVRLRIIRAYFKAGVSEADRKRDRALLDQILEFERMAVVCLSQADLALDWQSHLVTLQETAAEREGAKSTAGWKDSPK